MAHEVVSIGDRKPAAPPREMTAEEVERYGRWTLDYQRRLGEDPHAKYGPPEGEEWPPLERQLVLDN